MISLPRSGDDSTRMGLLLLPFMLAAIHVAPDVTTAANERRATSTVRTSAGRPFATGTSPGTPVPRASEASRLMAVANDERAAVGLPPLRVDDRLCAIARAHALDMATRRYFDHVSPEGRSPFDRMTQAHYEFVYAGENIALDGDAERADRQLWNSLEHRKNTLEPHYARFGVGAVQTATGEVFVEDFSD